MVLDRQLLLLGTDLGFLWYFCSSLSWVTLAYVFLNMLALTILYTCLFFYIRIQVKEFRKATSTSENISSSEIGYPTQDNDSPHFTNNAIMVTMESATQAQMNVGNNARQNMNRISVALLLYPAVYMILVLPVAIARISEFAGKGFSLTAVYAGACLFSLQGFAQVVLYTTTRKGIIPYDRIFRKFKFKRSASTKPDSFNSYHSGSCDLPTPSKTPISSSYPICIASVIPHNTGKSSVECYSETDINFREYAISRGEKVDGFSE